MSDTKPIAPRMQSVPLMERLHGAIPYLIVPILGLLALAAIGSPATWLTLTMAGLAMGMMIFLMASGLTLVFGLMDVINFGHGAFIAVGAFVGFSVLSMLASWTTAPDVLLNLAAVFLAIIAAMLLTGAMGYVFERVLVRPVYGSHLKQILVTMGGLIITQQLIYVFWGPNPLYMQRPAALTGSLLFGSVLIERYRVAIVVLSVILFLIMRLVLARTRIGLLVRAGVENGEMVESLGYRVKALFLGVFMCGSALAGLGGVMWGMFQGTITPGMGHETMILIFIVIIIGGLGSLEGCFIGALLVGLTANYVAFLAPKLSLVSNIGLMVVILLWRPEGLYRITKAK